MAKVISDEILKLKIIVNGDEAQKRVVDLELANKRLGTTLKDLQQKQQQLSRQRKKDSDEYKANERAIASLTQAIADNKRKIDEEIKAMDIMSLTMEQLRRRANDLRLQLNNMNPNSPEFALANEQLARINGRMGELRNGANASASSIQNLAGKFNHYSGILTAALATLAGVAVSIQSTIDLNNKLADAQTAVAKTTGLNTEEVKELGMAFSEFDTRTSRMDLYKIAETGGRLGIPQQEIKDFVREVDKANVALGDGFAGGVEAVTNTLGKLKGLYRETKELDMATAINQIGSAMNELGAAGAASEENIGEFALRLGSLPDKLKPTIAETLALGAAFEESGLDAERSSTAYSTFVRSAAVNAEKFAKVMGISKKEVQDLMNTDPLEFFLKFSEGAKGLDTTKLAEMLEYLKINDQFVIKAIGAASENTDRFRKSIDLSNQSLQEATSLQNEFNNVNNNAAAIYDKVKKKMLGMFTSDTVAKALNYIIASFGKMIGAVDDADGKWRAIGQTIAFVTKLFVIIAAGVLSFNAAVAISNLTLATAKERLLAYTVIQKLNNALNASGAVVQNLVTASVARAQLAYAILTRNTALQTAAQAKLNLVTKASPWGIVLGLVAAATAAYVLFAEKTDELTAKQRILNDVRSTAAQKVSDEKNEIEKLVQIARSETASNEQRAEALRRLNNIIPDHIGLLNAQNIKTAEGVGIINKYIEALNKKAYAEAVSEKQKELIKKQIDIQGKPIEKGWQDMGGAGTWLEQKLNRGNLLRDMSIEDAKRIDAMVKVADVEKELAKYVPIVRDAYRSRRDALRANTTELKAINAEQKKLIATDPGSVLGSMDGGSSTYITPGKEVKEPRKKKNSAADAAAKKWEREKEAMLKQGEQAEQLAIQLQIDRQNALAELETDWYARERMQIVAEGEQKVADLQKKMYTDAEFKKLDNIISKTKGREQQVFQAIKAQWIENNADLEQLQISAQETTMLKLRALEEKRYQEQLKKEKEQLDALIKANQEAINKGLAENSTVEGLKSLLGSLGYTEEALGKIRTWNEAKAELEKYYNERSLEEQIRFLRGKVAVLQSLMSLDPTKITPEQLEVLKTYSAEIDKLLGAKNALGNGKDTKDPFSSLASLGSTDLLGLNPEQWQAMFTNTDKLEENMLKVAAAVQVAQNMFATYASFVRANEESMLRKAESANERKKRSLQRQLQEGYINQETYKKLTLEADAELEKKKAETAYKQAKREKAMAIAQTVTNTAVSVMNMLRSAPWPVNLVMAGLAGAMGAVQVATIMRQPLPEVSGAEDGLYPVLRQQDKKRFNARRQNLSTGMYREPTILVGEAGRNEPEMVIDGKTMKRLKPTTIQLLNREIAQVRGFEQGLYKENISSSGNDEVMVMMMATLNRMNTTLDNMQKYGISAKIEKTARNGKEAKEMIQEFDDIKNRNKH